MKDCLIIMGKVRKSATHTSHFLPGSCPKKKGSDKDKYNGLGTIRSFKIPIKKMNLRPGGLKK